MISRLVLFFIATTIVFSAFAQDSSAVTQISSAYITAVSSKADQLEQKLDKKSAKAVQRLQKQEARMKRKLAGLDSLKAKQVFGDADEKYKALQERLSNTGSVKQYIPSLDTLSTSLKFLQQNPQLISLVKGGQEKLKSALGKVGGLEDQFQKAEEIKKFLKERRQFLKDQLGKFGFARELKKLNKQVYYYSEQLNEYKALLKDHKKAEKKAIELLSKTKLFKDFMRKNSMLASLFRMPGGPGDPAAQYNMAGLQTRAQVNSLLQQQVGSGGGNAQFRQNIQEAQNKINELKNKISNAGQSSSDAEMPEGFKPNDQKTKSFFKRLEYGTNIQTQKATNFFPVTSDIGLSLGYKLNDKSIIGIGASYKVGMGSGWNHIRISHEGVGIRSFIDWKVKGGLWMSGGYEQNYKSQMSGVVLASPTGGGREGASWQQSGLIGLSKVVSLKAKFFKKTKLQLLWDFLSYEQVPRTQPVVFRVGYTF
ncbi:MAG: hypothetical protein WDO16_02235 [Bacteroidota bacterium]